MEEMNLEPSRTPWAGLWASVRGCQQPPSVGLLTEVKLFQTKVKEDLSVAPGTRG